MFSFQAKTSGKFSEEELEKLWREFKHHTEKVQEYNILLETVSRTEGTAFGGALEGQPGSVCPQGVCALAWVWTNPDTRCVFSAVKSERESN